MNKLRLVERAIVWLGLAQPAVKAIADSIRDYPETFKMRQAWVCTSRGHWITEGVRENTSWVTHKSNQFSVLRIDRLDDWLPAFDIVNRNGQRTHQLGWWDRVLLAVSWPEHLEHEVDIPIAFLQYVPD
jgi:hypothetical protein